MILTLEVIVMILTPIATAAFGILAWYLKRLYNEIRYMDTRLDDLRDLSATKSEVRQLIDDKTDVIYSRLKALDLSERRVEDKIDRLMMIVLDIYNEKKAAK